MWRWHVGWLWRWLEGKIYGKPWVLPSKIRDVKSRRRGVGHGSTSLLQTSLKVGAAGVVWHVAHVAIINPKQKHSSNLPQTLRAKWGVFFHQTRTAAQALPWMKISGTQCSHRNNVVNSIENLPFWRAYTTRFSYIKCAIDFIPQLVSWFWWTFIAVFIWYVQSRPCIS